MPAADGEQIRDALRTVMLANREGSMPIGQASLPRPNQLVVLAPRHLQPSIEQAVAALVKGAAPDPELNTTPNQPVRFEVWVVDASADQQESDPALASVGEVLAEARTVLGEVGFKLHDRTIVSAAVNSSMPIQSSSRTLHVDISRLRPIADGVRAAVNVRVIRGSGSDMAGLTTEADLGYGRWTVLASLSGDGVAGKRPDQLVLIRATASAR